MFEKLAPQNDDGGASSGRPAENSAPGPAGQQATPAPETSRSPKIDLARVRIVPKLSKVEWDMRCLGLDYESLVQKYRDEGANVETILSSHATQQASLGKLRQIFDPSQFIARDDLAESVNQDADLVIAFGGDNHFVYVSHFAKSAMILGINSDPQRSDGALTSLTADQCEEALQALTRGDYSIEEWPRLEALVNGKPLPLTTSELFVGERERVYMSRYVLKHGDVEETQKSSGLLITTGAGSTGWYDSACRYLHPDGNVFARTEPKFVFLATEPSKGRLNRSKLLEGTVQAGESLRIQSLNDSSGLVSVDSLDEVLFSRGATLEVRISPHALKVIKITQ